MTTTCQQIYVRAKQSTPANADLVPLPSEVLARIEAEQQALFASLSSVSRDRFQATVTLTSSIAVSARVVDLSTVAPVVERLLDVTLADGRTARQVDVLDVNAELSPRYIVRGRTLIEVSNDWSARGGAVQVTLVYVYGPTSIDPAGAFSQTVSVPDEWCDLLVLPLQMYLAGQRAPTSDTEVAQLESRYAKRVQSFADSLTNYGGVRSNRFDIPTPMPQEKK